MMRLVLLLASLASVARSADPLPPTPAVPAVRMPAMPLPPPPPPPPAPVAMKLLSDQLYIIDSDIACVVLSSPAGVVKVSPEAGPLRIRGKFVDGVGQVETRTYKGKFIYCVDPLGVGVVEILVIPAGTTDETAIIRRVLDVGVYVPPKPPDPPVPPVPPVPPTPPPPIPADGFRALIVFDTAKDTQLPREQFNMIYGAAVQGLLNQKCVVGPDGKTREWRIWASDTPMANVPKLWQDAFARPKKEMPWLILSNGKSGYEGPLPKTVQEMTDLINKYSP